jgi:hypothetical protein
MMGALAVTGTCGPREKFVIVIPAGSNSIEEFPTMTRVSVSVSEPAMVAVDPPTIVSVPWYSIVAAGPALALPIITVVAAMFRTPLEAADDAPAASRDAAYVAAESMAEAESPAMLVTAENRRPPDNTDAESPAIVESAA